MFVCVSMWVCTHECSLPERPGKGPGSPRAGGRAGLPIVLEVNLAPLQEWYMPVTAELPLQSQEEFF